MTQVARASTPRLIPSGRLGKQTLSPQLVEAAVSRLCWISLTCAVVTGFLVYVQHWLQPELVGLRQRPVLLLVPMSTVLVSIGINVIARYRLLSPLLILNLGLAFEVVVAAGISFSETALLGFSRDPVLGASKLAVWITLVGLLIPNKPSIKFVTALASASMWPLAYLLNLHLFGYHPLPLHRLLIWMDLPYVMAVVNYGISARMWSMETAAQKARDLGSYDLVSLIGRGGMGEVWRARHRMLARDAAIKLIRADLMLMQPGYASDMARKRFAREARAIASLQSPHTVFLFDFGVAEDGSFYYVMELLDGISLQRLVDKFGPQPPSRVIHILRQVCASLEEAHRRGLIHRDIKPNNIFDCIIGLECDFIKVLDFGLVKSVAEEETLNLTAPGATAGTPTYMPPEVALGKELDGRADIYSLGCVAYFLLTGEPVFGEKTATAMAMAHVRKHPVPPSQRTEGVIPSLLEDIVLRCLAKRPEERPHSAQELNRLLASVEVPEWTQENAADWWQTYLPASSLHRTAFQPRSDMAETSSGKHTVRGARRVAN